MTVASPSKRTSGKAIASLVLGISSVVFLLPLVGAIGALILGYSARKDMAGDPSVGSEGYATAGIVLGWIGITFAILFVLFVAVGVGVGGSGEGSYISP